MTDLTNNPVDAYIELCQVHQIGSHPWNSNPWCDRGPTVINPETNEPYGECLRVTQMLPGTSIEINNDDLPILLL